MSWIPGFEIRDLGGPTGGPYDRHDNPKLLWHTWEGYSWNGAESAFRNYPPHVAVNPIDKRRCQYVPLDRHAYSLAGTDAEDSFVIQVEVAGYAGESHDWTDEWLEWLGAEVLAPIREIVDIPGVICPQGFHGEGEGIILASPSSPIRYNMQSWDAFSGHVGHQHAPAPDDHWDPGRLDVRSIINASEEALTVMHTYVIATPNGEVVRFLGTDIPFEKITGVWNGDPDNQDAEWSVVHGFDPTLAVAFANKPVKLEVAYVP
jgi:hypothetical protein